MKTRKHIQKPEKNMRYFWVLIIIFLILWGVPLLFLRLGILWSGLLPVVAFLIAYSIVNMIKMLENKK